MSIVFLMKLFLSKKRALHLVESAQECTKALVAHQKHKYS